MDFIRETNKQTRHSHCCHLSKKKRRPTLYCECVSLFVLLNLIPLYLKLLFFFICFLYFLSLVLTHFSSKWFSRQNFILSVRLAYTYHLLFLFLIQKCPSILMVFLKQLSYSFQTFSTLFSFLSISEKMTKNTYKKKMSYLVFPETVSVNILLFWCWWLKKVKFVHFPLQKFHLFLFYSVVPSNFVQGKINYSNMEWREKWLRRML